MKRFYFVLLLLLLAIPLLAFADQGPPPDFIQENPRMASWVFGLVLAGLLVTLGWFVKSSDYNNKKQWEHLDRHTIDINDVKVDVAGLKGEHRRNHGGVNPSSPWPDE